MNEILEVVFPGSNLFLKRFLFFLRGEIFIIHLAILNNQGKQLHLKQEQKTLMIIYHYHLLSLCMFLYYAILVFYRPDLKFLRSAWKMTFMLSQTSSEGFPACQCQPTSPHGQISLLDWPVPGQVRMHGQEKTASATHTRHMVLGLFLPRDSSPNQSEI